MDPPPPYGCDACGACVNVGVVACACGRVEVWVSCVEVRTSKLKPEGPASVAGEELEPGVVSLNTFSSSRFFKQAALGLRLRSVGGGRGGFKGTWSRATCLCSSDIVTVPIQTDMW